jgi:hypothetical protein
MTKFFTQTNTIRFVYNEMAVSESQQFLKDLDKNESNHSYFTDLIGLLTEIDSLDYGKPSDKCVANILLYASKSQSLKS